MKRLFSVGLLVLTLLISCSDVKDSNRPGKTTIEYLNYLKNGEYDKYVSAVVYADSMTPDYRKQMEDLLAQTMATEQNTRGGWKQLRLLRDTVYQEGADVFVEITYGDSTKEEVCIPMVLCDKGWKLK